MVYVRLRRENWCGVSFQPDNFGRALVAVRLAPANEALSLDEQGKCPKELAPGIPRLLEIESRAIRFQTRPLAARLLGAALTGHPCPAGLARLPWLRPRTVYAAIPSVAARLGVIHGVIKSVSEPCLFYRTLHRVAYYPGHFSPAKTQASV